MAKGKSKNQRTRDPSESLASLRSRFITTLPLRAIDDRRSFDFEPGTRPARLFSGSTASVTAIAPSKKQKGHLKVPYQIAFSAPRATLVCVRRNQRREILHAFKKTGRKGQKRPKRNTFSNTKC